MSKQNLVFGIAIKPLDCTHNHDQTIVRYLAFMTVSCVMIKTGKVFNCKKLLIFCYIIIDDMNVRVQKNSRNSLVSMHGSAYIHVEIYLLRD